MLFASLVIFVFAPTDDSALASGQGRMVWFRVLMAIIQR